jgi:hypothetical protein
MPGTQPLKFNVPEGIDLDENHLKELKNLVQTFFTSKNLASDQVAKDVTLADEFKFPSAKNG